MGPRMYTQGWTAGTQHYSVLAQQPTLALKPLPTFAVYLDPRPQSWFHGQVGWVVAEPVYGRRQGNYGVNNRKKKKKNHSNQISRYYFNRIPPSLPSLLPFLFF